MATSKVAVTQLTKRFKIYPRPAARLAEWLSLGRVRRHTSFTALEDISFDVPAGEFFGIIGPNGAGKSTLLKILTGILTPSSGTYCIDGRITSLLELGTGFNPDLTGRENLFNSARLIGFPPAFMRQKFEQISDFAGLGDYMDVPIRYYSSGMLVRLAFSMFAHVEPDVFVVDEALSVGDVAFSQKCFARIDQMRESGCTSLFVTHDLAAVRKYCQRTLFIRQGRAEFLGPAIAATDLYLETMSPGGLARQLSASAKNGVSSKDDVRLEQFPAEVAGVFDAGSIALISAGSAARIGSGEVRLAAVQVTDGNGRARQRFGMDEAVAIHLLARVQAGVERATFAVQLANRLGVVVWGTSHARLSGEVTPLRAGTWMYARFDLQPGLGADRYTLDVGFGDASGEGHVFDRITAVTTIEIAEEGRADFVGLARIPCTSRWAEYPA